MNDMYEDEIQQHLAAHVEVPYDIQFIGVALDWATEIIKIAGGEKDESEGIRLALEETLVFIIKSYPDAENWELVRITLQLLMDGQVEISLSNAGPPVHIDRIPTYDPASPAESNLGGLWHFLAEKSVDDLEFKNLGMDGWRVYIRKKLANPAYEKIMLIPAESMQDAKKKFKFTTRIAKPEDAAALVDLTYDTYRYSYPDDEFYHKSRLAKDIAEGKLICLLVESDGVIVGNSTYSFSKESPTYSCSGALMIRPEFRTTRAIIFLIREFCSFMAANPIGVDLFYANIVTAHKASQKVSEKGGSNPLALLLSIGTPADYRGLKVQIDQREHFLLCAMMTTPPTMDKLYLPEKHHAIMSPMLNKFGCRAELSETYTTAFAENTTFDIDEDPLERTAYVTIKTINEDWINKFRQKKFLLFANGIKVVLFLVPAWEKLPPKLDDKMKQLNAIFTGVKPISVSKFYLVYIALTYAVDFESINLHDPLAENLKTHVHKLYSEMVEG